MKKLKPLNRADKNFRGKENFKLQDRNNGKMKMSKKNQIGLFKDLSSEEKLTRGLFCCGFEFGFLKPSLFWCDWLKKVPSGLYHVLIPDTTWKKALSWSHRCEANICIRLNVELLPLRRMLSCFHLFYFVSSLIRLLFSQRPLEVSGSLGHRHGSRGRWRGWILIRRLTPPPPLPPPPHHWHCSRRRQEVRGQRWLNFLPNLNGMHFNQSLSFYWITHFSDQTARLSPPWGRDRNCPNSPGERIT